MVISKVYRIFNRNVRVNAISNLAGKLLLEELSSYPDANGEFDIEINYMEEVEIPPLSSRNPASHYVFKNGFLMDTQGIKVLFLYDDGKLIQIDFSITANSSSLRSIYRKWRNIQFCSPFESVGQLFHEFIAVPMAFHFDDCAVVHSSGVVTKADKLILFGGTGGVGKTSLELELCLNQGCKFFADDIAICDNVGVAHPNMAYPKIYGYNLEGETELKNSLFKGRGLADQLQYWLLSKLGPNKVRRRVSPDLLYDNRVTNHGTKLTSYVLLFRSGSVQKIESELISVERASEMNKLVISSEYNVLFDHIKWNEYNKHLENESIILPFDKMIERTKKNFEDCLKHADSNYLIKIPLDISHKEYKKQMISTLENLELI